MAIKIHTCTACALQSILDKAREVHYSAIYLKLYDTN